MAKKKKIVLTIEELLKDALVPQDKFGGIKRIDKKLNGELDNILKVINSNLY